MATSKKTGKPHAKKKADVTAQMPRRAFNWFYPAIIAAVLIAYGKCLAFGFTPMDDTWLIVDKMDFLRNIHNLPLLFTEATLDLFYRPLLHVSFMSDALIAGPDPAVFHITNILLHITGVTALFRFLVLLGVERTVSILLCFIFALHPVNVQAVAWIPGRNDSLLALFAISSCSFLLRYMQSQKPLWLVAHMAMFACALFTKETALVLPAVYLVLLFTYGKSIKSAYKITVSALWVITAATSWYLHSAVVGDVHPAQNTLDAALVECFSGMIIQTGKCLLPVQQSVYPLAENISLFPYVIAIALVVALMWKYGFRNKQFAAVGATWFLLFLAVPTWYGAASLQSVHYEHRVYLALPGLLLMLSQINLSLNKATVQRGAVGLAFILAIVTFRREEVYSTYDRYAQTGVDEAPGVAMFHDLNGYALHQKGRYQLAINSFNEAIKLDSTRPTYYNHRGNTWLQLKMYRNAIYNYNKVLAMVPNEGMTYYNRSIAYYSVGDYYTALSDLEKADSLGATVQPDYADALNRALRMIELQQTYGE